MLVRQVPRTGESVPALGLGTWHNTWHAFGEGRAGADRAAMADLLGVFFRGGGSVLDSSPAHAGAEAALGGLLRDIEGMVSPFVATKIRVTGRREGEAQLAAALDRLGRVDLMQVQNLIDVRTHLPTLRAAKEAGRIRYIGVTHFSPGAFDAIEALVRAGEVDFVQIPYSLHARAAEGRLLPLAAEKGTAVIVMLPFEAGGLFAQLRGRALPPWAAELGCTTWAQLLLKFVLSHPAVTCVIPATGRREHLEDNMRAGEGRLPDEALRARMIRELG
ncbi:aldo/keto reductase [Anaeromyxobacter oryzae]|uniref:Aldo/keto reductase n=1 Tax=Anaeromyxobacter oryzae TaxID=2918170 RepID=A0ABM7WNK5_9BACT|nr:aldo/keto reductase [Anaeromyxobacter oryzae]BDG01052.1 aldo/keto reductase [Anaeromyxobacter oryzae]